MRGGRKEDELMTTQVNTQTTSLARPRVSLIVQTAAALAFGIVILFAVGFAPLEAAHNAAHDVRHTLAFPCH
jgi:cobalt transporter subunit CbtB